MGISNLSSTLGLELFVGQMSGVKVANSWDALGPWGRLRSAKKERSLDNFPALQLPVVHDNATVEEGDEEGSDNGRDGTSDTERNTD
jgi:hypothetical protein